MTATALSTLLLAAGMHATWNFIVKRAKYKQVFIWLALTLGSLCSLSILFISPALPAKALPYALVSAIVEVLYYLALTLAYDSDDFSLTYPIARGAAPALLALWTTLFLHEAPSLAGVLGIICIIIGLIIVGAGGTLLRLKGASFSAKGIIAALAAALCISIYSAIDGAAVRFVPSTSYTILVLTLTAVFFAPVVFMRFGVRAIIDEVRTNNWRVLVVGILILLAYALVLHAYAITRISYAGALREVSIVFAALAGWAWLDEKFGLLRTIGACCIFIGMIVIAVLG